MSKENWNLVTEKKLWGIDIPQGINFYINKNDEKLKIHINSPRNNMQDDKAAFEAWALIFHIIKKCEITLSFEAMNWDGYLVKSINEQQPNYMRFLYRVWKFNEQMVWFNIEEENQNDVCIFIAEFNNLKNNKQLVNNIPNKEAEISKYKGNKNTKSEHFFENTFVRVEKAKKKLKDIVKDEDDTILKNIYNQLPNGLFKGSYQKDIKELNRVFPTGYFDMWGISDKNELCLFELKVAGAKGEDVNNKPAGIISELFFYANYSKDIFMDKSCCDSNTSFRGYDKLLEASNVGISKIKAYFLAPKYHSRIEENIEDIEKCLNNNSLEIEYRFLHYNYEEIKCYVDEFKKSCLNNPNIIGIK